MTRRRTRERPSRSPSGTVHASSGWPPTSARRARATPGSPRSRRRWSHSSTPTACRPTGGSGRCWASSTIHWWRRWHRVSCEPGSPPATKQGVRRSTVATGPVPCVPGVASPSCRARPSWSGPTWRWVPISSMRRCAVVRTWTLCGVWARPAGTCATCRRARWPTRTRRRCRPSWPAGPSTGRQPPRWPGATAKPWLRCTFLAGRWRCGASCWLAGLCSRWLRWLRP